MKLAVFFPALLFSAWACSYGLVDCLRRMGHEVKGFPIDPETGYRDRSRPIDPEAVIVSGPEHIAKTVPRFRHIPTVAWLHETVEREDYGKLDVDAIKRSADIVFCPGIQDEKYGFRYLPFGVDTDIFTPCEGAGTAGPRVLPKLIDAGFIGLLYPKRQAFLAELRKQGVNLTAGNVQVLEIGGVNPRKTAELYAENIRKMKVFVNLPTLSQLAVTKIYEVLACGVPILTPKISEMKNFGNLPAMFYEPTAAALAAQLRELPSHSTECGTCATMAHRVHDEHRLELRCETLIAALKEIGVKESVLA